MLTKNGIKIITSLGSKKYRQKYNLFVVEGVKNVKEVLKSSIKVKEIYCTNENLWKNERVKTISISDQDLKKISFLANPNEALAVCELPEQSNFAVENGLILMLDSINDPGNLGTIIRLADWFGIKQIICSKETVDLYNPKVVMSTMGSFSRVEVVYTDLVKVLENYTNPILGTFMDGESIYNYQFPADCLIVMGNEANGISPEVQAKITSKISIPAIGNQTESLNVAMATSITLGEFFSQRLR